MNKSGSIEELARRENLTEKKATDVVNLIFKGFTEELKISGRIEIRGFGSFRGPGTTSPTRAETPRRA